jgi:hypothetical protein
MKKLVYLEWADATSPEINWMSLQEALDWSSNESYWVCEVGFVLEENKKFLLFASGMSVTKRVNCVDQYKHITKIPKTWIRKRIDLTKYVK